MREIKFRGKRVDNGEWVEGYFGKKLNVYTGNEDTFIMEPTYNVATNSSYFTDVEVDSKTVGEFVGLFDDLGKEIYSGDIVRVKRDVETKTPHNSIVTHGCDGASIEPHESHRKLCIKMLLSNYCDYGFGGKVGVSCKVIGNIHDNPELVTV